MKSFMGVALLVSVALIVTACSTGRATRPDCNGRLVPINVPAVSGIDR